jgi:hypothetical protein
MLRGQMTAYHLKFFFLCVRECSGGLAMKYGLPIFALDIYQRTGNRTVDRRPRSEEKSDSYAGPWQTAATIFPLR